MQYGGSTWSNISFHSFGVMYQSIHTHFSSSLSNNEVLIHNMFFALCCSIKSVACPNCTKLDTALVWVVSNKPDECEAPQMNGSPDMPITDRQTELPCCVVHLYSFTMFTS